MRTLAGMLLIGLLATLSAAQVNAQTGVVRTTAELVDASGQSVGTLTLTQEGNEVHLLGSFSKLPPGAHGIHFHAVGTCTPNFEAAGPHYNPADKQHGLENPAGTHAGDLANLQINADGTGSYDHKTQLVTLLAGPTTLYDADGSALVIHANADDYKTDPSGNSGGRIACAVIPAAQRDTPAASPTTVPAPSAVPTPSPVAGGTPARLPDTGLETSSLLLMALAALSIGGGLLMRRRSRA